MVITRAYRADKWIFGSVRVRDEIRGSHFWALNGLVFEQWTICSYRAVPTKDTAGRSVLVTPLCTGNGYSFRGNILKYNNIHLHADGKPLMYRRFPHRRGFHTTSSPIDGG